jgi:hypothetical protein
MSSERAPIRNARLWSLWKQGPSGESRGPFLISYTEFTPHTLRDLPQIYRAAERLRRTCGKLEGAVGITIYWQPFRRCGGSLSVWENESALRHFVSLPFHLETMRRYRSRGSLRAISWEAESLDLRAAFQEGQRALDDGKGRQR